VGELPHTVGAQGEGCRRRVLVTAQALDHDGVFTPDADLLTVPLFMRRFTDNPLTSQDIIPGLPEKEKRHSLYFTPRRKRVTAPLLPAILVRHSRAGSPAQTHTNRRRK
jgi:hypothetical protein